MVYRKYHNRFTEFPSDHYTAYIKSLPSNPGLNPQSVKQTRRLCNVTLEFPPPQVWDSHGATEFQPFTPQWNDATLDSIGGFILNLVLKSCYFDRDECREILGKKISSEDEGKEDGRHTPVFVHTYLISTTMETTHPIGAFIANPLIKDLIHRVETGRFITVGPRLSDILGGKGFGQ
eukprot:sb/3471872/